MISLYSGLIPIIKQAALDAVNSTQPVNIVFGKVTSASPLKIQVASRLTLEKGNLVLSPDVSKHSVTLIDSAGKSTTYTVDNSLKKGDSVIMARMQGGDRYLVICKAVNT